MNLAKFIMPIVFSKYIGHFQDFLFPPHVRNTPLHGNQFLDHSNQSSLPNISQGNASLSPMSPYSADIDSLTILDTSMTATVDNPIQSWQNIIPINYFNTNSNFMVAPFLAQQDIFCLVNDPFCHLFISNNSEGFGQFADPHTLLQDSPNSFFSGGSPEGKIPSLESSLSTTRSDQLKKGQIIEPNKHHIDINAFTLDSGLINNIIVVLQLDPNNLMFLSPHNMAILSANAPLNLAQSTVISKINDGNRIALPTLPRNLMNSNGVGSANPYGGVEKLKETESNKKQDRNDTRQKESIHQSDRDDSHRVETISTSEGSSSEIKFSDISVPGGNKSFNIVKGNKKVTVFSNQSINELDVYFKLGFKPSEIKKIKEFIRANELSFSSTKSQPFVNDENKTDSLLVSKNPGNRSDEKGLSDNERSEESINQRAQHSDEYLSQPSNSQNQSSRRLIPKSKKNDQPSHTNFYRFASAKPKAAITALQKMIDRKMIMRDLANVDDNRNNPLHILAKNEPLLTLSKLESLIKLYNEGRINPVFQKDHEGKTPLEIIECNLSNLPISFQNFVRQKIYKLAGSKDYIDSLLLAYPNAKNLTDIVASLDSSLSLSLINGLIKQKTDWIPSLFIPNWQTLPFEKLITSDVTKKSFTESIQANPEYFADRINNLDSSQRNSLIGKIASIDKNSSILVVKKLDDDVATKCLDKSELSDIVFQAKPQLLDDVISYNTSILKNNDVNVGKFLHLVARYNPTIFEHVKSDILDIWKREGIFHLTDKDGNTILHILAAKEPNLAQGILDKISPENREASLAKPPLLSEMSKDPAQSNIRLMTNNNGKSINDIIERKLNFHKKASIWTPAGGVEILKKSEELENGIIIKQGTSIDASLESPINQDAPTGRRQSNVLKEIATVSNDSEQKPKAQMPSSQNNPAANLTIYGADTTTLSQADTPFGKFHGQVKNMVDKLEKNFEDYSGKDPKKASDAWKKVVNHHFNQSKVSRYDYNNRSVTYSNPTKMSGDDFKHAVLLVIPRDIAYQPDFKLNANCSDYGVLLCFAKAVGDVNKASGGKEDDLGLDLESMQTSMGFQQAKSEFDAKNGRHNFSKILRSLASGESIPSNLDFAKSSLGEDQKQYLETSRCEEKKTSDEERRSSLRMM